MWNSLPLIQTLAGWAFFVASICGAIAFAAGITSTILSNRASAIIERESALKIAQSNSRAEEAKARAEEATARAEEARQKAEETRLEAERIKREIAWRDLGTEERSRLLVSAREQRGAVNVCHVDNDPEAAWFAMQFAHVFSEAGWHVGSGAIGIPGMCFGIAVVAEGSHPTALLERTLSRAGLRIGKAPIRQMTGTNMIVVEGPTLFIGSKPGTAA
jgi:hypothetical protein